MPSRSPAKLGPPRHCPRCVATPRAGVRDSNPDVGHSPVSSPCPATTRRTWPIPCLAAPSTALACHAAPSRAGANRAEPCHTEPEPCPSAGARDSNPGVCRPPTFRALPHPAMASHARLAVPGQTPCAGVGVSNPDDCRSPTSNSIPRLARTRLAWPCGAIPRQAQPRTALRGMPRTRTSVCGFFIPTSLASPCCALPLRAKPGPAAPRPAKPCLAVPCVERRGLAPRLPLVAPTSLASPGHVTPGPA